MEYSVIEEKILKCWEFFTWVEIGKHLGKDATTVYRYTKGDQPKKEDWQTINAKLDEMLASILENQPKKLKPVQKKMVKPIVEPKKEPEVSIKLIEVEEREIPQPSASPTSLISEDPVKVLAAFGKLPFEEVVQYLVSLFGRNFQQVTVETPKNLTIVEKILQLAWELEDLNKKFGSEVTEEKKVIQQDVAKAMIKLHIEMNKLMRPVPKEYEDIFEWWDMKYLTDYERKNKKRR